MEVDRVAQAIEAGACTWKPGEKRLFVRGNEVQLPWRVMECWSALVEARGELVPRETLHSRIWGNAVMEDSNLAQTVAALRKVIDPAPDGQSHIVTVPRMGYRLAPAAVPINGYKTPEPSLSEAVGSKPKVLSRRVLVAAGVTPVAIAGGIVWGSRIAARHRSMEEAERLTRTAMYQIRHGTMKAYTEASPLLEQAGRLSPGLALQKAVTAELTARAGEPPFDNALELAKQAVAVDPACSDCRAILGYIQMTRFWDWRAARENLEPASAETGAEVQTLIWMGQLLMITGRFPEALRHIEAAIGKDPQKAGVWVLKGMALYFDKRYDDAIAALAHAEALDPQGANPPYWRYHVAMMKGDGLTAGLYWRRHYAKFSGFSFDREAQLSDHLSVLFGARGKDGLIDDWLNETKDGKPRTRLCYERAVWMAWRGDNLNTLAELEEAEKLRPFNLIYVGAEPMFELIRGEPRFQALLERLGLKR